LIRLLVDEEYRYTGTPFFYKLNLTLKTMKHIRHKLVMFFAIVSIAALLSSCMMTKTSVGTFKETRGNEYTYSKGKQWWLFWGIVPIGRTDLSTPTDGSCQVITRYNFWDFLISGVTAGILTTETIRIVAKR
jgi:hypothetical protein